MVDGGRDVGHPGSILHRRRGLTAQTHTCQKSGEPSRRVTLVVDVVVVVVVYVVVVVVVVVVAVVDVVDVVDVVLCGINLALC